MATQDRSPSLLIGQQWSTWTDLLSSNDTNDDETYSKEKVSSDSMKLGKKDMGLFGFCPARDEFTLVVCEKCNLLTKPQALKQHIESRHGPTNLSSLGNVPASALNSELGKKLLMPEPLKSSVNVTPSSTISTISGHHKTTAGKAASSNRPPTKASLKQVPASARDEAAPRLGVSMKISPVKAVKSGNRITPSSSSVGGKSSKAISSNPVVKMEKLPERLPPPLTTSSDVLSFSLSSSSPTITCSTLSISSSLSSSSLSSLEKKQTSTVSTLSKPESSKISTLVNGSLKTAVSLTTPASMTFSSLFNMSAAAPSSLVVTTKTSTDTPICSRSLSTLVTMSSMTKPIMIAPVMTVTSSAVSQLPQKTASITSSSSTVKSSKLPKDQRPKLLPCKDREYDANKHCGVKTENGKSCTRSLTCKTHALSLRRAVPGRCKSFDDLLKEHKAAKDALIKAKAESQSGDASGSATTTSSASNRTQISSSPGSLKGQQRQTGKDIKLASTGIATLKPVMHPTPSSTTITSPPTKVSREHTNIFQRFTSSTIMPPAVTIKEEVAFKPDTPSKPSVSSSGDNMHQSDARDPSFLPHHPRPMAICQFGGRLNDRSCYLFSRKTDYVRAAVHSALERQLNPPPHKKLCVESKLPKEAQLLSNSHDPYDFNLIDPNGGGNSVIVSTSMAGTGKPLIKPKSKTPSSPVAASLSSPSLLSLPSTHSNAFSSVSLSSIGNLPSSSLSSSSVVSSLPLTSSTSSSSFTAIHHPLSVVNQQPAPGNKSTGRNTTIRGRDNSTSSTNKTTSEFNSSSSSSSQQGQITPGKRKRSGSSGHSSVNSVNSPGILLAAASANGPILNPTNPTSVNSLTLNAVAGDLSQQQQQQQQLGIAGIISSSAISNHQQTRNLIAIPSVNLANAATLNQVGNTSGSKISNIMAASSGGSTISGGNIHQKNNSVYKDINLFVTGIDSSSLVNGQYVNITSAQLAELAASQGQTLVLNNFPSNNNSGGITTNNNLAGLSSAPLSSQTLVSSTASSSATGTTPKPSKRSRTSSNRSSHHSSSSSANSSSAKASANSHPLEGFKLIPSNNVIAGPSATTNAIPANTVLMDGAGLPGGTAVLTSVTLAPGVNPTLVAITSSSAGSAVHNSNNDVPSNPSHMLCGEAATGQFHNTVLSNGLIGTPLHDKSVTNQRHLSSSAKSFIQHHHHQQQQQQHKTGQPSLALGNLIPGSAMSGGSSSTTAATTAHIANQTTTLFKAGSTFNLTKSVGGKLTVQPVSLTFPIVNQQGLAALTSASKSHQHQHHHHHHSLQQHQQPQQQHTTLLVAATSAGSGGGGGVMEDTTNVRVAGNKTDLHLQAQISNAAASGNVIS